MTKIKKAICTTLCCIVINFPMGNGAFENEAPIYSSNGMASIMVEETKPIEVAIIEVPPPVPLDKVIKEELGKFKTNPVINFSYVKRIIKIESYYDSSLVGSSGERGLMQIMEGTWYNYTNIPFDNAFERRHNIHVGIKHLRNLYSMMRNEYPHWDSLGVQDKQVAIGVAYNGGFTRFKNTDFDIGEMPKRSQKYAERIME
jgi:soluble lytic murein transglycosylase-like protein